MAAASYVQQKEGEKGCRNSRRYSLVQEELEGAEEEGGVPGADPQHLF